MSISHLLMKGGVRMGKLIDLTDQRFGKLVVLENMGKLDGYRHY